MDQPNALSAAKQAFQGMQPQGAQSAPVAQPDASQGMPQPSLTPGLPVPPPHVAQQLALASKTWDPMVLGTLIYRALKEHANAKAAPQPGQPPMGLPPTAPMQGGM